MKLLTSILLFVSLFQCQPIKKGKLIDEESMSSLKKSSDKTTILIPANKSYVAPLSEKSTGIFHNQGYSNDNTQIDINNWTSDSISINWYLHCDPGDYAVCLEATLEQETRSKFQISLQGINEPEAVNKKKSFTLSGNGENSLYEDLIQFSIKEAGFYQMKLKPICKTGNTFGTLRNLILTSSNDNAFARYANWLSSPSVHLNYLTEGDLKEEFDWLHGEILVPEGHDPLYTFYMSIGFFRGYFGMQVNHEDERRILFSVWDSSDEPVNRDKVNKSSRVELVGRGPGVTVGSFGNEGTGGQSFKVYPWKTGIPVKFLVNVRHAENSHILLSAWFKQFEQDGWQYMATWDAPKDSRYFTGFHSFIENFGSATGQEYRKAYYYNLWGKPVGKDKWIPFTKARMTHTDGDDNSRSDFGAGTDPENPSRFFMWSGGYGESEYKELHSLEKQDKQPAINTDSLNQQIDSSIINRIVEKKKTNWKVIDCSSEEKEGEGASNGHSFNAIDNDLTTFWHSQWYREHPKYPHHLTIDMGQIKTIKGLTFYQRSSRYNGRIKELSIKVSNDTTNWRTIGDYTLDNTGGQQVIEFTNEQHFRYFKVQINKGYNDGYEDVYFSHLAEINYF
jgi:hypothetical protein